MVTRKASLKFRLNDLEDCSNVARSLIRQAIRHARQAEYEGAARCFGMVARLSHTLAERYDMRDKRGEGRKKKHAEKRRLQHRDRD